MLLIMEKGSSMATINKIKAIDGKAKSKSKRSPDSNLQYYMRNKRWGASGIVALEWLSAVK